MKQISLFLIIFAFATNTFPQSWNWANSAGNNGPDFSCGLAIDNQNNSYIGLSSWAGSSVVHFNTISFNVLGERDFFIAKFSSSGDEIWVKQYGGYDVPQSPMLYDFVKNLVYDSASNCIIVYGRFVSSCDFGTIELSSEGYNNQDLFIAKLDLEGNCIWAKRAGGGGADLPHSLSVDTDGNSYITASLPYDGNFDTIQAPWGGYLTKYSPEGNALWAKKIISTQNPGTSFPVRFYNSLIIDESLYLKGFRYASTFTVDTISLSVPDYSGLVFSRFNLDGSIQWLKCVGGPHVTASSGEMCSDSQNNICFTGGFVGGYATFGEDTIFSTAAREMFVVNYNSSGEIGWIKQSNSSQSADGYSLCLGNDGFLYATGKFNGIMNFDNYSLTSVSTNDLYLLKMDQEGNMLGGDNAIGGTGCYIKQDFNGFINIYGSFLDSVSFGETKLVENTHLGLADVFIAQHAPISGNAIGHNSKPANSLFIYANPTTGICNISIPEELRHEEKFTLLVYDNAGKLILQQEINMQEEKISLNLEARDKGIYQAVLTNGKKKYSGKVVFE